MNIDPAKFADDVAPIIQRAVAAATAPLEARIKELEAREPPAGPQGEPGKDGLDGKDGAQGEPGKDGESGPEVSDERVEKAAAAWLSMHPPRDGRDGLQGAKGQDGSNGRDGLSVDDFDLEMQDDGRTLTVHLRAGGRTVSKSVELAIPQYVGIHKSGAVYRKGDFVTHGGQLWGALAATGAEPGQGEAWRLATRKGRDGAAGARGEKGAPGVSPQLDPRLTVISHQGQ